MAVVLGLAAALTYGAADFLGGLVSRRARVITVVLLSQLIGSSLMAVAFPLFPDGRPSPGALGFGAGAGLAGATGVLLLYRGLAAGRMSVVAPVTAVEAASVPVLFGLVTGERPSALALAGVGAALVAVALVSSAPSDAGSSRSGLPHALGAGLAFGAFFILLDRPAAEAGLWPLLAARAASVAMVAVAALASRAPLRPPPGTLAGIAGAGLLDVGANLLYVLATQVGLLAVVAVLTSMYPVSTVVLARVVLKEGVVGSQLVGLLLAVVGVSLIAAG